MVWCPFFISLAVEFTNLCFFCQMEAKFSPFDISKVKFLALHIISCMVFLSSLGLICYVLIPETNFLAFACDLHLIIDASKFLKFVCLIFSFLAWDWMFWFRCLFLIVLVILNYFLCFYPRSLDFLLGG